MPTTANLSSMLYGANISTLVRRREDISQKFFRDIIPSPLPAFHHLLPAPREQSLISRFRTYENFQEFTHVLDATVRLLTTP